MRVKLSKTGAIVAIVAIFAAVVAVGCTPQVTVKESSDTFTPPPYTYSPSPEPTPNGYVYDESRPDWADYHHHLEQFGQENIAWTSKAKKIGRGTCEAFDTAGVKYTIDNLFDDVADDELVAAIVTGASLYVCPEYENRVRRYASS